MNGQGAKNTEETPIIWDTVFMKAKWKKVESTLGLDCKKNLQSHPKEVELYLKGEGKQSLEVAELEKNMIGRVFQRKFLQLPYAVMRGQMMSL